jgi:hypothetical protein
MLTELQIHPDQANALRTEIREYLQHELATLMCVDRPRVRALLDGAGEPLDAAERAILETELSAVNERILRVRGYLGRLHEPGRSIAARPDSAVLVDLGDGPRLTVLTELAVPGVDGAVALDSPLGVALRGVAAGATVHYPTPTGSGTARVLAVEA